MADMEKSEAAGHKPPTRLETDVVDVERSSGSVVEKSADEGLEAKDPNVVDFDGPDDPENPMNWPSAKKTVAIAIVSLMTLLSYVRIRCPLAAGC